jgi:D-alanyl-D-alanine carboxypeptidase
MTCLSGSFPVGGNKVSVTRRGFVLRAAAVGALAATGSIAGAGASSAAELSPGGSRPAQDLPASLRSALLAKMATLRTPGAIILVDRPGGTWQEGLGSDNPARRTPMRLVDHMRIGSVTKTFTATVVLELVDRKKIGLDDHVARYVPGVPHGDQITIRELLNMTSGLFNTTEDDGLNADLDADPYRIWTDRELFRIAFAHPSYFAPGTDFHYANTNYDLLGFIAEQVGEEPLATLMHRGIFEPLGLHDTVLPPRASLTIPVPFGHGYNFGTNVEANNAYQAALAGDIADAEIKVAPGVLPRDATHWSISYTYASGGAISTAHDLRIWARALAAGTLLSPATQALRLQLGAKSHYGLGIEEAPTGYLGHNGAVPGYQTYIGYDTGTATTVIVLANLQAAPNIYLGNALPADDLADVVIQYLAR